MLVMWNIMNFSPVNAVYESPSVDNADDTIL